METDCDISLSDNYCLICGSSSLDGSSSDDDHYVETFLTCIGVTENYSDRISEHLDGFWFCLKCKSKLEELDCVRSQIDRLLFRSKQLTMTIIAGAVQQSSRQLKNSSATWIRRLIRNKFSPRVLLKKCDSEKQMIKRERPRKSFSVARKRTMAHSLRASAEPKEIEQPENTEYRSSMEEFDASSLLHIKFEQLESDELEDNDMGDPLQLDAIQGAQGSNTLMLKYEGGDTEVDGPPESITKRPTLSGTNVSTVTLLYKRLPSTVDSQMSTNNHQIESNDGHVLLTGGDPSSVGPVRAEPLELVQDEGHSYRFGEFPVKRLGYSYKCLTCDKTFSGKNSAFQVKRHISITHAGGPESFSSSDFEPKLVREISPQDFLYRDSIPFTSDENKGFYTCGDCGVKSFSCTRTSGKDRIMKHMEFVHTLREHESVEQGTTRERSADTFEFCGVLVSMIENKHVCGACSKIFGGERGRPNIMMHIRKYHHLKPPHFIWKCITEVKPGEYLYLNKLSFTYSDGIFQCGLCPRIFTAEKRPGVADISVVLHLRQDHSDMLNVSGRPPPAETEKPREGMNSPAQSEGIVDEIQSATSFAIEQALLKLESDAQIKTGENPLRSKFPFTYKGSIFQCGLCPWTFQTDNKRNVEKYAVWHFKGQHLGKPITPTNQKKKSVERGRTVQNISRATNVVVSKPVTPSRQGPPSVFRFQPRPVLQNGQTVFAIVPSPNQNQQVYLAQPSVSIPNGPVAQLNSVSSVAPEPITLQEEIRQIATEEGHGTSYEYEGVRVTVINGKYLCGAEGCTRFFVGRQACTAVIRHIRNCHLNIPTLRLRDVTEVKPRDYLYRKKFPPPIKGGTIQCGLCPRFFVTGNNAAAAEMELMSHLQAEHSANPGERTVASQIQTPLEPARVTQSLPAVNTVVSQPATLLDQGSPPVFRFKPYAVLHNRRTFFAVVRKPHQIPQVSDAQPGVSMPNGPVGQISSVNSSQGLIPNSATRNKPVPRSY